eukprot:5151377-Karenia_brevis.AAC.1
MDSYKHVIRLAARTTRNNIFRQDELPVGATDCILSSCARAVFNADVAFAKYLIQQHTIASQHLIVSDNSVKFRSAETFSSTLSRARHAYLHNVSE